MYNKNHLINKLEFSWIKMASGLDGLHENGEYVGITKVSSTYIEHDVEFYTNEKYDMDRAMCTLEDYAISLGLDVYAHEDGQATTTQKWYTFIIK